MDLGNLVLTGVIIGIILGEENIRWYLGIAAFAGYLLCLLISHLFLRR